MSYIEKENLIKADIASIENRVRHAFNQGYDLGFKDGQKRAKEPTTKKNLEVEVEDCISRVQAVTRIRQLFPDIPTVNIMNSRGKWHEKYKPYLEVEYEIKNLPSVYPKSDDLIKANTQLKKQIEMLKLDRECDKPSDDYKRGWTDAITLALKETHDYYTEDGVFKAIQEESLIGVGMVVEEQGE